jgi:hypothetical protein
MTYANIHFEKTNLPVGGQEGIAPFLEPLIHHLALAHPQWIFTCRNYSRHNSMNLYHARTIDISEKREPLGSIELGVHGGRNSFFIHNERIKTSRKRGDTNKTRDIKKAIKIISKFVGLPTTGEMLGRAIRETTAAINSVQGRKEHDYAGLYYKLRNNATELLVAHWGEISKTIPAGLMAFPAKYKEYCVANEVKVAYEDNKAYLIWINGIDYAIKHGMDGVTFSSSENLPDFLRRGIGMLKLVEDSQIIDGVGLRVDARTFLILPEA